MIRYIKNEEHYELLLDEIKKVRHTVWIGTADLKDLYIKNGTETIPFLAMLEDKVRKGVSVRLLHAKEPGVNFRKDFDKYPLLLRGLERALCPRIHFKLLIFDLKSAYIGSANITGAAFGMKNSKRRNFEAGIFTDDIKLVESTMNQFDDVWIGRYCLDCDRKDFCKDRIID